MLKQTHLALDDALETIEDRVRLARARLRGAEPNMLRAADDLWFIRGALDGAIDQVELLEPSLRELPGRADATGPHSVRVKGAHE